MDRTEATGELTAGLRDLAGFVVAWALLCGSVVVALAAYFLLQFAAAWMLGWTR